MIITLIATFLVTLSSTLANTIPMEGTRAQIKNQNQIYGLAHKSLSEKSVDIKFLIKDFGSNDKLATVYFQDSKIYPWHYQLANQLTGQNYSPQALASECQKSEKKYVCGHIKYIIPDRTRGYKRERYIWSLPENDQIRRIDVIKVHELLKNKLPFEHGMSIGGDRIDYYTSWMPMGERQGSLVNKVRRDGVHVIESYQLLIKGEEKILNPGFSVGYLRFMKKEDFDSSNVSHQDFVVLNHLPLDLPPVAGIITSIDQPELSHINLLSKNRGTPNVYMQGAFQHLGLKALNGKIVKFRAKEGNVRFLSATQQELNDFWSFKRPLKTIYLNSLPSEKKIVNLKENHDFAKLKQTIGIKAANLYYINSKASKNAPRFIYAIPFDFFHDHMKRHHLWDEFIEITLSSEFKNNLVYQAKVLKQFRKKIIKMTNVTPEFLGLIKEIIKNNASSVTPIRFRSSSNAEDLPFFNGAGLYNSKTGYITPPSHKPKKTIERAILKVWASYFNFNAYREREFYRIDHLSGRMGILIHPSYPSNVEKANGVVLSEIKSNRFEAGLSIALGDKSMTNPVSGDNRPSTFLTLSYNRVTKMFDFNAIDDVWKQILNVSELKLLTHNLMHIHESFTADNNLLPGARLDFEIKIVGKDRKILIKQVRQLHENVVLEQDLDLNLKGKLDIYEFPYVYTSTCRSSSLEYTQESGGYLTFDPPSSYYYGSEPTTSYLKIKVLRDIQGVATAGEVFEFINGYTWGGTTIGHPFMHHGPYDLRLRAPEHERITSFAVEPFSHDISINNKDLHQSLSGPCVINVLFSNHPLLIEMSIMD